jgi:hypothetical protein
MPVKGKKKVEINAANPRSSRLDVIRINARFCAVPRALIPQLHRGRLWTVLDIFGVGENCWASALRFQFHFGLGEFLGTAEEEELRSGNEEQEDIDGTREVEHRDSKKRNRRWHMVTVL